MARRHRRIRGQAGYTLVEVVVAVLLTSIMVTSVFSVALTSKQGGGKSDRKLVAAQAAKTVTSQLRNFVTGCDCDADTGVCVAASCTVQGPTPRAGVGSWYFNDPANNVFDDRGDVWALTSGRHVITGTGVLPAWFLAAPYSGSVQYTVDNSVVVNGRPMPRVSLDVVWTEP
jgi:type II secretory pathway pseudopilin PulG